MAGKHPHNTANATAERRRPADAPSASIETSSWLGAGAVTVGLGAATGRGPHWPTPTHTFWTAPQPAPKQPQPAPPVLRGPGASTGLPHGLSSTTGTTSMHRNSGHHRFGPFLEHRQYNRPTPGGSARRIPAAPGAPAPLPPQQCSRRDPDRFCPRGSTPDRSTTSTTTASHRVSPRARLHGTPVTDTSATDTAASAASEPPRRNTPPPPHRRRHPHPTLSSGDASGTGSSRRSHR